jgi:hypothetical protein
LALALGLVGYIALLSLRSRPRAVALPLQLPEVVVAPAPQRLARDPQFDTQQFAVGRDSAPIVGRKIAITLRDLPATLATTTAGVATFQADTGADFVWTPLSTATASANGALLLESRAFAAGDLVVTLASARSFARHGYLARTRLALPPATDAEVAVELRLRLGRVRLRLPDTDLTPVPLRLVRTDDPEWLPMEFQGGSVQVPRGGELQLLLGAGSYEVRDPLAPTRSLRFEVPDATEVDVSAVLEPAKGDRP